MTNNIQRQRENAPVGTSGLDDRVTNQPNGNKQSDRHTIEDRYNFHDASFRRHYQLNYHHLGEQAQDDNVRDYETFYAPAYRFGYELAEESGGKSWDSVETEAQQHWQSQHRSGWSDIVDAVRYGWKEQRDPDALRVHHRGEYGDYHKSFQTHYAEEMHGAGVAFEHIEPAYQYGYNLAVDPAYSTHLWDEMEPEVRTYYETEYAEGEVPWEHYRDAVHHAWYDVRATG